MIIKSIAALIVCLFTATLAFAQFDPMTNPLVLQTPEMKKVRVEPGKIFHAVNADTSLKFDVYYPAGFNKKTKLPVVVFNNGVGVMELKEWQVYKDWARLMAANGMIAVTHQARTGKTETDFTTLLSYLRAHADELGLNADKFGIWVCSGNTPTGWPAANEPGNSFIKAVAIYYGFIPPTHRNVKRKDLEILLVRAGLDGQNLNASMEELMSSAMKTDAHVEYINYPGGQHAFDAVDNTPRSKEIILQTVDFFKRNLLTDNPEVRMASITNRQLWQTILTEGKTAEGIVVFKNAYERHKNDPTQLTIFNNLLNENNLNQLGYQLLNAGRVDDAIAVFTANKETFPLSPNTYDALGDAYDRKGDKENVLLYAVLTLEKLNNNTNIPPQFARGIRESAERKINDIVRSGPHKRAHHELVYDEANKTVLLVSGSTPLNGGQSFRFFNDIWQYKNSKWTRSAIAGNERSGIRLAFDTKRNRLFSYGGFTGNSSVGELRVLEGNEWRVLSNLPQMAAAEGGLVYDAGRDRLIAFGGSARMGQYHSSTWEWDGYAWKDLKAAGPAGRMAFAMVYDSRRNKTIAFGGMGEGNKRLGDTWELDGNKWTRADTTGPSARVSPGYAYDSKRGLLIIFGGTDATGSLGDTWAWDGKTWKLLSTTGPAPRSMGYMAYDKERDVIVLFGGRLGWPNDADDTWEWNGTKWSEQRFGGIK